MREKLKSQMESCPEFIDEMDDYCKHHHAIWSHVCTQENIYHTSNGKFSMVLTKSYNLYTTTKLQIAKTMLIKRTQVRDWRKEMEGEKLHNYILIKNLKNIKKKDWVEDVTLLNSKHSMTLFKHIYRQCLFSTSCGEHLVYGNIIHHWAAWAIFSFVLLGCHFLHANTILLPTSLY